MSTHRCCGERSGGGQALSSLVRARDHEAGKRRRSGARPRGSSAKMFFICVYVIWFFLDEFLDLCI
jgi:hypothetical protein